MATCNPSPEILGQPNDSDPLKLSLLTRLQKFGSVYLNIDSLESVKNTTFIIK